MVAKYLALRNYQCQAQIRAWSGFNLPGMEMHGNIQRIAIVEWQKSKLNKIQNLISNNLAVYLKIFYPTASYESVNELRFRYLLIKDNYDLVIYSSDIH
jgi:hypothetical protein